MAILRSAGRRPRWASKRYMLMSRERDSWRYVIMLEKNGYWSPDERQDQGRETGKVGNDENGAETGFRLLFG